MSLNWDASKIKDYNENYPSVFRTDPPTEIWNQDRTEIVRTIEHEERECWNPVTEALVMSFMGIGMTRITNDNVDEVYTRLMMYSRIYGGGVLIDGMTKQPRDFKYEEVVGHIGLTTNVTEMTKVQFKNRLSKRLREIVERNAKKAKSDLTAKRLLEE